MKIIADVHIHSHYSRATSRNLTIPELALWAQRKGVHIVGTGDIAHPGWLQELKEHLQPAEDGLFRLKPDVEREVARRVPPACRGTVRFILAGEISTIYKKNGRTRKIHHVVFAPDFAVVEALQERLEKIGNIRSDGRPILGLDSRDLLEILLEVDPRNVLIPAHIWTPWFALLGSKSGFDSVEECFEDLTPHIFALETGLSSDPPMNWRVSALDRYTLVSNSDAHSPQKLAREANILDIELSYDAFFNAIRSGSPAHFLGTVEFFPEEGKYHYDGHRKCGIMWDPKTTIAHQGICPVCGKPVTVGVMHRVEELADRPEGVPKPNALPYYSLIPLPEILSELLKVGAGSKRVQKEYERLLSRLGPELAILMDLPLEEIAHEGGERLAEGIGRMRRGEVTVIPGYDGEYGVIRVFEEEETRSITSVGNTLFDMEAVPSPEAQPPEGKRTSRVKPGTPRPKETQETREKVLPIAPEKSAPTESLGRLSFSLPPSVAQILQLEQLNEDQLKAVLTVERPLLIVAGPGTGKTRTLTVRIAYLILAHHVPPEQILAITFTNKAAQEMAERLSQLLGEDVASQVTVKTFHAFGAMVLREFGELIGIGPEFIILTEAERRELARRVWSHLKPREVDKLLGQIDRAKAHLEEPDSLEYTVYERALREMQALDYGDLVTKTVFLLEAHPDVLATLHTRYRWISVDEYQDVNYAQYRLLRLLTSGGANIMAIGDPDQAIYGFRGADRSFFLRFQEDYPGAQIVRLTQNYRSSQAILDAASQVISKAGDREEHIRLLARFISDVKLDVYPAPSERAEAEYVVHQIERMVGGTSYFSIDSGRVEDEGPVHRGFGDFAVLYRLRSQVVPLLEAFERAGIPYQTVGTTPWSAHPVIRKALERLREYRPEWEGWSVQQIVSHVEAMLLAEEEVDNVAREGLQRLVKAAASYTGGPEALRTFVDEVTLRSETDFYDPRADRVALMTLHAAKGLEFPVVFIVGVEEGLLPYSRAEREGHVDEERRLFYVGMTRAKEKLILTYARKRLVHGRVEERRPSRFLDDIEAALKEIHRQVQRRKRRRVEAEQLSLLSLLDDGLSGESHS